MTINLEPNKELIRKQKAKEAQERYRSKPGYKEKERARQRLYRAANKDKLRARDKIRNAERSEERKEYRSRYYQEHKDEVLARAKVYAASHRDEIRAYGKEPCRKMLSGARERTKKFGLPVCDLTLDYLREILPEYCPVFGIRLEQHDEKPMSNSPSLDRIIPELGYTVGNVQIISNKANLMKRDANNDELLMFAEWVKRNINNTNE